MTSDALVEMSQHEISPHSFIIKVTNSCNIKCDYCYYMADAPKKGTFINDAVLERLFEQIEKYVPSGRSITFYWHGGEPLLIGRARFERILDMQQRRLQTFVVRNALQTNALKIDADWTQLFRERKVGLGISIDGDVTIHDKHRLDHRGHGTYARVVSKARLALEAGINPKCLVVVNPDARGDEVLRNIVDIGFKKLDFLLPMRNWDCHNEQFAMRCGIFLVEAFRFYLELADDEIDVTLFSSVIRSVVGGVPERCMCHSLCSGVLTIEPNGDVGLCDDLKPVGRNIYILNRNILQDSLPDIMDDIAVRYAQYRIGERIASGSVWKVPLNWCPATRFSTKNGFSNRSVDFVPVAILQNEAMKMLRDGPIEANLSFRSGTNLSTAGEIE